MGNRKGHPTWQSIPMPVAIKQDRWQVLLKAARTLT